MFNRNLNPDTFVSHWFRKDTYLKCYGTVIQPVRVIRLWPETEYPTIEPPKIRKKAERPKTKRRIDKDEPTKPKSGKLSKKGVKITCSLCKSEGHNKQGCPNRGRPQVN